MIDLQRIRAQFLIDQKIIYLNHGSFGACPKPVFEVYQKWQRELEHQPVEFLGRRAEYLLAELRAELARYLGASSDEIVYFPNPTSAVNMVARNLARSSMDENPYGFSNFILNSGDEILASDHEYGALNRTWRYICRLTGANYVISRVPLPMESPDAFIDRFWEGVTPKTRLIFISHITSPTAIIFPIREICRRAQQAGIYCLVDGAHAPGQIPLNLHELGCDFYAGACHKWLCAPKGSGFLYVRKELQSMLDPLVVSWGYEAENPSESKFIDYHEWQGTRDLSAYLSVPAAIQFQQTNHWDQIRRYCHDLAVFARDELEAVTGMTSICTETNFQQMFSIRLPSGMDPVSLKSSLFQKYKIEVPVISWNNEYLLRVSIQAYNDETDILVLTRALKDLL